jgi:predicted nucleotidyltransferase component of viral defense system
MRPSLVDTAGYQPQTVEKVERLLELLTELRGHPFLGPRVRLHGGTALNVFHLGMPRLSIDADLTYMGQVAMDKMLAERPEVERALATLGTSLGYEVTVSPEAHAGRTFKLHYRYAGQSDLIKVDLIYLNRAPLLDYEEATCQACSPHSSAMTLALPELIAGKTKALFDRLAVRDLYDVHRIQTDGLPVSLAASDDDLYRLQRRVRIYYASLSKPFPCAIDGGVVGKFAGRTDDVERDLYPVLHVGDRPTLEAMMESASRYIDEHVAPKEDEEDEYLLRLGRDSEYVPSLLFSSWPEVLQRAKLSPAAAWKVVNLKKRPAAPEDDYPEW